MARNALGMVANSASHAIFDSGSQGLEYDAPQGRNFTSKGFVSPMEVDALSGT